MRAALLWPLLALVEARGRLFPWLAVFLGAGIGLWFALPFEPGRGAYLSLAAALAGTGALRLWGPEVLHAPALALGAMAAGGLACGLRVLVVAAPTLTFAYYGPVQGRVVEIDRSQSDALRLTLDRVVLEDVAPASTPHLVRISLQGQALPPEPGQVVLVTARLAAPDGPVEPGGFDFRRMAWFDGLGAVGYTRNPYVLWAEPEPGEQAINRLRTAMSRAIMAAVPGDAGAFASGAMTGDRSGISRDTVEALRDSNLSHLLAISGMNMAFLTGFVFVLLRYGLALVPPLALRVNAKKLAAVAAFGVALFYLLLSGANVATERAFVMVSVMLGAVLFDRRALTLRSVAVAGLVLLLWQPESLLEPGFQLSFAATVVLIAGFGALDRKVMAGHWPRWLMPLFTLVFSSVLAGAATAPYSAAYFNRFTDYGLLANLLTVPVMSLLMAAGAVAALLAPVGLAGPALWVMGLAAQWILLVAHWVAGLDGAVTPVLAPHPAVIPLITLAGIGGVLWQGRGRFLALVPLGAGLALWLATERPLLLISSDGRLAGLLGAEGRALSSPRGAGFAAEVWLEKDGDLATQEVAAARPGFEGPLGARRFEVAGLRGVMLSGKNALAGLDAACAAADLVVLAAAVDPPESPPPGCLLIDRRSLAESGALAFWPKGGGLRMVPVRGVQRVWTGARPIRADQVLFASQPSGVTIQAPQRAGDGPHAPEVVVEDAAQARESRSEKLPGLRASGHQAGGGSATLSPRPGP